MNNDKGYEIYKKYSENDANALELVFTMVSKDITSNVKDFKGAIDFLQKSFNHKVAESNIASTENKLNQFSQVESSIKEIDKLIKTSQDSLDKEEPLCEEARSKYEELTKRIRLVNRSKEFIEKCIKILNDIQNKEALLAPIEKELDKLKKKINAILDIKESIKDAKEITVNFNKKGSGYKSLDLKQAWYSKGNVAAYSAGAMRNLFLFFNAGVQSLANFGSLARNNAGKFGAVIGGFTAAGFMMPFINKWLMDLDRIS